MRLPYLQVNQEIFDVLAPAMSVLLEISEGDATLYLLRLWKCLVDTGTEERAPDGVIRGPKAVQLLERAVRWTGTPGAFVQACNDPSLYLVEVVPGGLRIRGAERYQAAWRKAEAARERAAEWRRARTERAPNAHDKRDVHPETQTQTQTYTKEERVVSPSGDGPLFGQSETTNANPPGSQRPESDSSENAGPARLRSLWNEVAHSSLPRWQGLSKKRRAWANQRLRERPLDGWRAVIERINASAFCRGENDRGWRADPEFLLRSDTHVKVMEGKYDDAPGRPGGRGQASQAPSATSKWVPVSKEPRPWPKPAEVKP